MSPAANTGVKASNSYMESLLQIPLCGRLNPTQSALSLFPICKISLTKTVEGEHAARENLFFYL